MNYEHLDGLTEARDDGIERGQATRYILHFGDGDLNFRPLTFTDPVPLGRQILEAAGIRGVEQVALVALLPSGPMEDVRLGEPLDLRARGIERVIAFRTDILFPAFLQGQELLWGRATITGEELYSLATLDASEMLFIDTPGGTDVPITPDSVINLATPGVERFVAAPRPVPGFEVTINFNGVLRRLRVKPQERIAEVLAAARPLFGNPGGDLVLVEPASGRILDPNHTVAEEAIVPDGQLLLRPRAVQGG
ncbi:multiubiquitin domain-containing protein [Sphingomonas glacialis]|uniref:Multi-ubiquitin domain-containing protein n=1 Tax=Sphingomonas glacialis TaxID=658225 RepID=A0A502FZV5_9SPHN|nr:multiubiquitin domain-containing protein [Sphingomonas glacialis]TPG55054.1 hypothetical protein EAH76_10805 [Sphingomonas glacialis]